MRRFSLTRHLVGIHNLHNSAASSSSGSQNGDVEMTKNSDIIEEIEDTNMSSYDRNDDASDQVREEAEEIELIEGRKYIVFIPKDERVDVG